MRNVTSQIDILFPWCPPLLCFMDLLVAPENICLMSACLILLDLVHSFLSVVCVEMTCFAPCLSFLWDYGDAQCSPMMYSYKRALLCHTHHLVEPKSFKCSRIWIFCRSSIWCSTMWLLQVLCLVLYTFSLAHVLCFKGLWGSEDSMLSTLYCNTNPYCARTLGSSLLIIRTLGWSYHNIFLCSIGFSDPLIWYFFCRSIFQFDFLCNLWILNIVWSPSQLSVIGYVHLISLILWEMHTLWGSWPSKVFLPFRQWLPMGEKFRGFKGFWFMLWFCS